MRARLVYVVLNLLLVAVVGVTPSRQVPPVLAQDVSPVRAGPSEEAAPVLDHRLGVVHASGLYPRLGDDFLVGGAREARALGFQTIEVLMTPQVCATSELWPSSRYQTLAWCPLTDLVALASSPEYRGVFDLPFDSVFITTESVLPGAATAWGIRHDRPFSPAELDRLHRDVYGLARYLIDAYGGSGKTFVIQTPNEMDWMMLPQVGGSFDPARDPSDQAVQNAIVYWNTVQQAVDEAKAAGVGSGLQLYHACEVNLVFKAMQGGKTATNNVVPWTHCDLYGYSSYDTLLRFNAPGLFDEALEYLAHQAPDSPAFGDKNVYVSEFGVAERKYGAERAVQRTREVLDQALAWGVPYVLYWEIYDNGCSSTEPTDEDCPGLWIRKPSGGLAPVYDAVYRHYPGTPMAAFAARPGP